MNRTPREPHMNLSPASLDRASIACTCIRSAQSQRAEATTRENRLSIIRRCAFVALIIALPLSARGANLYDSEGSTIEKFTPAGVESTFASGLNDDPEGLAFDSKGNLYVVEFFGNYIDKFTPAGVKSTFATGVGQPTGLAFDSKGNLYVAESATGVISKFTPAGVKSTFASTSDSSLYGLAFDSSGNLYDANSSSEIHKFTPAGVESVFASGLNRPIGLAAC
jgi:sugar lactone lactonase YvrE